MTIILDGSGLTIEKIVRIPRFNEPVELAPAALERIKVCREMIEEKIRRVRSCTAPIPALVNSPRLF